MPIMEELKYFDIFSPSNFQECLAKAFGKVGAETILPRIFDKSEIAILRGMAATWIETEGDNPYQAMIDVIKKHGKVKVWADQGDKAENNHVNST